MWPKVAFKRKAFIYKFLNRREENKQKRRRNKRTYFQKKRKEDEGLLKAHFIIIATGIVP